MYKAVIFDMDGVIVDSEPHHERAFLHVFEAIGHGDNHGIEFSDYYGRSDRSLWVDFIARHQPGHTLDELLEWRQQRFLTTLVEEEPIFDGLPELVARLHARYPLALASGSRHPIIDAVLAMRDLRQYFGAVVSSTDVAHGKPQPDIFLHAAALLGVAPGDCCVVEDAQTGVQAARAAGMDVIAITNTFAADKLADATYVVDDYAAVERVLLG